VSVSRKIRFRNKAQEQFGECIGDLALVETIKRISAGIAYRHPSLMKRAHVQVMCGRTSGSREEDSIHELLANQFSSVARNYVEEAYQMERLFPMDN
jgi:hypothetical protein